MPKDSRRCISQISTEDSDDSLETGRRGKGTTLSHISDQLFSGHEPLQEQYRVFMRHCQGVRDLLEYEKTRDQNHSRQLETKDAEIQRLLRRVTDQSKIPSICSSCHSGVDLKKLHDVALVTTRDEWQKGQALTMAQKLVADQKTQCLDLERSNGCLQSQVTSLTGKLESLEREFEAARRNGEAEVAKAQRQLRDLREKQRKATAQRERRRRDTDSEHKSQLSLRKHEYCDLQHVLDEVEKERRSLRDQLTGEIARSAVYVSELEIVKAKLTALEAEKSELQRQFDASRSEQESLQEKTITQSSRIEGLEHKLGISEKALSNIRLQAGKSHATHQCSEDLRKLGSTPERLCDPSHGKFSYVTDCGRLLCNACALAAANTPMAFGVTVEEYWEIGNCPGCKSEVWSWQPLDVSYNLALAQEMKALWDVINSSPN